MAGGMKCPIIITLPFMVMACAADTTNYPSLARRDAEKVANAGLPAQPAPAATNPEMDARLARLVDQAQAAHEKFDSRRAKAESVTANPGSVGSDSWANASLARADLESARSDVMIALADLDEIYAAERVAGRDAAATAKARAAVIALVGEEDRVLASLRVSSGER
jgi:hypothetical protein